MQRVVSFNTCSLFILIVLLVSLFSRKMIKGRENKIFIIITILALITSFCDIFRWIKPKHINISLKNWCYLCTTLYFIARNIISSAYLVYTLVLSGLWYKFRQKRFFRTLLCIIPFAVCITMFINLFTHSIFYFDQNLVYVRGRMIWLTYVYSFVPMGVSLFFLIKERRIFNLLDFCTLLLIYPGVILGVVLQIYNPKYLLENITTTYVIFTVSLIVHRPEENINIATESLGFNAFFNELRKNFLINIPTNLIFIHINNYKKIKSQFNVRNYYFFLKNLINGIGNCCIQEGTVYNLDNCIFVVNCIKTDDDILQVTAENIQEYLNHITYNQIELQLETTLCVVKCPDEINEIDKIISFGNNFFRTIEKRNVVTYLNQEEHTTDFKLRNELDGIIKEAIKNEKFQIYYQPIYNVKTKKFTSAEALIRLHNDEYGFIPPSLFIPAAETSGAIHQIGDIVIKKVCNFINDHNLEKIGLEYIEINLSVAQCLEQNFAEKFINTLEENGIDKNKLNLEITETATNFDKETTNKNINVLSRYGLTFSLDDFGTGYSNIKRVSSMPLSIIKLDKTFVEEYQKNEMSIIIRETVDIFKKMNKHILVEGIEDKKAFEHFAEIGCDYIQGFYFSKPLPEKQFIHFIRENNKEGHHV